MASLSVQAEGSSIFVVCANPVFALSDASDGTFTFEVFDADSASLKRRLGKIDAYSVDRIKPFFGELVSLEPVRSTHQALTLLRDNPTVRGTIKILRYIEPGAVESYISS